MTGIAESDVETAALEWLAGLGYAVRHGADLGPDGAGGADGRANERVSYDEALLGGRLQAALERLNPHLPAETLEEVRRKIEQTETPSLIEENRRLHRYLADGVHVEMPREDGGSGGDYARLIDFDDADANDWLAVSQFTVIEGRHNRRPDVTLFVNGLPLAVIELKNPGDENATLQGAYNQLQTYKAEIPSLFRSNGVLVSSDGIAARVGSLTADPGRFMPWRAVDSAAVANKTAPELETLIKGVFDKRRFLELLRDFTVFEDTGGSLTKIVAGYHQFHAVRKAVRYTVRAMPAPAPAMGIGEEPAAYGLPDAKDHPPGDQRVGVIWHTQGSGKSLLMVFYAGLVIKHAAMQNPTLVVITDRNDLDAQLFRTFSACRDLLRQTPQQAESRAHLQQLLNRPSGGVIFTIIQKFKPEPGETEYPRLSDRGNVVVIADEAHRSQYGFRAKVERRSGGISYGFAKYLRDALPAASFIGFTGTPIEKADASTPAVFGDYIDIYDISQAVADGVTVPIYYESRLARIELNEAEKPKIDAEVAELTEDEAEVEQEQLKQKWTKTAALVGAEKRLRMVAADLVRHFEDRVQAMDGKAMIVCMSRRICVALYDAITALRPDWHNGDDNRGKIKIVMTGSAADPAEWQQHISSGGGKARGALLTKRIKDPDDELKLVIVRDMWLTGFDAPCLHTMYVDKPMHGHGLMQAIARVNRVFRDKPGGLIVDYIGIAQNLKIALGDYSKKDRRHAGIDQGEAVAVMLEKYEIVRDMFHGFDYLSALQDKATAQDRLQTLATAMEWILAMQQKQAAGEATAEGKKAAHRRFKDAVLALSKAFALAAASDEARAIRDEVGFFQTVRAALAKTAAGAGLSSTERDFAIQQIVSRAVISTEIVDILQAAGLNTPDIAILSDEFLAEVQGMEKKNLAMEALRKLINGEIRSRSRARMVESRAFSQRLEDAIARYHANAITTAEVIQELIVLAKDIRAARQRGEEEGLSDEEIAFYDALAQNESAVEVMGNEQLRVIAQVLLNRLKANLPLDWQHRETSRAKMRVLVKRILKEYGYPPDLQDAAVQTVLRQAEALSAEWAAGSYPG